MQFDVEYLAGLELAEKDGMVRFLKVPFAGLPGDMAKSGNNILLALQKQGYEILNATPVLGTFASQGLWITYK